MKNLKSVLIASVSALTVLAVMPVHAQNNGAAPKKGGEAETLETVVVTATKRSEDVQKIAMTVNAIDDQKIKDLKLFSFADIQTITPGLVIDNTPRASTATLRGVSFNPDSGAQAAVDTYWNETPIASPASMYKTMYDLGDIEVLRGPQGTLRGRSSPAGAILVTSHKPDMHNFGAYLSQSGSDRGLLNTEAWANVPIIAGELALRVAAVYHQDRESGVVNIVQHDKNRDLTDSFRATLEWVPTDYIDITLVHQELRNKDVVYEASRGNPVGVASPGTPGALSSLVLTPRDRISVDPGPFLYQEQSKLTSLTVTVDFNGSTLTSITGWQENNQDYTRGLSAVTPGHALNQTLGVHVRQLTQEVRFQSTGTRFWDYLFGVYLSDSKSGGPGLYQPLEYPGTYGLVSGPIHNALPLDTAYVASLYVSVGGYSRDIALFMDHRFHLTDSDQIEVGARWLDERTHRTSTQTIGTALYDAYGYFAGLPAYCPAASGFTFNASTGGCDLIFTQVGSSAPLYAPQYRIQHAQAWTGSASYTHQFTDDLMAYASWAHSYRPSTAAQPTSPFAIQPELLVTRPEKSEAFELGTKGSFFNNRLQANLDVFMQRFVGYINVGAFYGSAHYASGLPVGPDGSTPTCATVAACAATTTPGYGNAYSYIPFNGNAKTQGVELSLTGLIMAGWTGQLNVSYTDAHYVGKSLCSDYNNDGKPDVNLATSKLPGLAAVQPGKNISVCNSGLALSDDNPLQLSFHSEYNMLVTDAINGYVRVLYQPVLGSNYSGIIAQTADMHIAAHHMVNLYIGANDPTDGRWDVSLWVKNLFDETAARSGGNTNTFGPSGGTANQAGWPLDSGYRTSYTVAPREFGMTLSYRIGH